MNVVKKVFVEFTLEEVKQALVDALPARFADKWFVTRLNTDGSAILEQVEAPEK